MDRSADQERSSDVPDPSRKRARPVVAEDFETWPDRWKVEGFNCCWRRGREALEALAAGGGQATQGGRAFSHLVYEMKLTERVLEQQFRRVNGAFAGESQFASMELRLFTMPAATKEQLDAVEAYCVTLIHEVQAVSVMAKTQRGLAFLRTVHCLACDIAGPGFEMWNDYEALVSSADSDDCEAWREHWRQPPQPETVWGGTAAVFENAALEAVLQEHFLAPDHLDRRNGERGQVAPH
jgi:hypothetical protein